MLCPLSKHQLQCTQCSLCPICACLQDDQRTIDSLRLKLKGLETDKKYLATKREDEVRAYVTSLQKAKVMQCSQLQATYALLVYNALKV